MTYQNQTLIYFGFCCTIIFSGCQIETKRNADNPTLTLVDPKYSLAQDRSDLAKLRESIPEAKRKSNDEKAVIAEWMNSYRLSPSEVREKYDNLVRKKRELFNNDLTKIREDNSKAEKKNRDAFLKDLESRKNEFSKQKHEREEKSEFYSQIDDKRRSYFSEERDKREEFESTVRDQRKNFEDYLKEKNLDFSSELKSYSEARKLHEKK